jgi:signal peptidase complex subunit 2
MAIQIETEHITLRSKSKPSVSGSSAIPPQYVLTLSSSKFTNHGKTLLNKRIITEEKSVSLFFDVEGTMDQTAFENWLASAYQRVGESSNDS